MLAIFMACLAAFPVGERYVDRAFGFQLEVPDGWERSEVESTPGSLQIVLTPPKRGDRIQLTLRAMPVSVLESPERARDLAIESTQDKAEYTDPVSDTVRFGKREVPSFSVHAKSPGGNLRVRQHYLAGNGAVFILQSVAPTREFDGLAASFQRLWTTFEIIEPDPGRQGELRLDTLAARCGTEIDWAPRWEDAARLARKQGKLVLVSAWTYGGFRISDQQMAGTFMDLDVIELVRARYIAVRWKRGTGFPIDDPAVFGLSGTTFGAAAMLVTPDGLVVAQDRDATYEFLLAGLGLGDAASGREDPSTGGAASPSGDSVALAASELARGEIVAAEARLANAESAEALRLRASLHRRLRRGALALEDLARARKAPGTTDLAVELDVDEAEIRMRTGASEVARKLLERVVEEHPEHVRVPEALCWLGAIARTLEGPARAESIWDRLIDEHPESRWAWLAAAARRSTAYSVGRFGRLEWPDAALLDAVDVPPFEPGTPAAAAQARREAIAFLLERQRPDGSWASEAELVREPGMPADDFKLAFTAIAAQALIAGFDAKGVDPAVHSAVERATSWLLAAYAQARAAGGEVYFMDYGVWSRAYLLSFLAAAREAKVGAAKDLARAAGDLLDDLRAKQRPGGGWSYYVTRDLGNGSQPEQHSISFTTAAVVRALLRARAAGFEVPKEMLDRGLDCLEDLRTADRTFEYMIGPGEKASGRRPPPAGAAGRGPVCALALFEGRRAELRSVRESLDLFLEHRGSFAKELGKVLIHTGPEGQGSHYLLFDYAGAAAAIARLPRGERIKYARPLLELILAARTRGGGFIDNPPRGIAGGTGLALLALESLGAR